MRSALSQALIGIVPLFLGLVAVVAWGPAGNYWGTVETPKAQGEAYDATQLNGMRVLSPDVYEARRLDRLIREPENTVSNLGYVAVGLAILFAATRRLSVSLGVACIFLGIGSGFYHASLLPEWRLIDILGVYTVLGCMALIGGWTAAHIAGKKFELSAIGSGWLGAFAAGVHRNDVRIAGAKIFDSTVVVATAVSVVSLIALIVGWRARDQRRARLALAAVAVFAPLAFFGGWADRFGGLLAAPNALIQGHAVWHSFGAVALLATYELFSAAGFDRSVFARPGNLSQTA